MSRSRRIVFETERLVARDWDAADAPGAFAMYGDPEVVRFIGGHLQRSVESTREFLGSVIERNRGWPEGYGSFPLFLKRGGRLVGTAIFKLLPDRNDEPSEDTEIGWHVRRDHWGRGLATEVGRALLRRGFEVLGLQTLHAVVEPANTRSSAVARKLGMVHQGRTIRYYGGIELEHYLLHRDR